MGELLAEMEKHKGGRPELKATATSKIGVAEPVTLAELGITHVQSSLWQKLAGMADAEFEKRVAEVGKVRGLSFLAPSRARDLL